MCSTLTCKMFITSVNSLLPPYKVLINGNFGWRVTECRTEKQRPGVGRCYPDPPGAHNTVGIWGRCSSVSRGRKLSPFALWLFGVRYLELVRALWSLIHMGFILWVQMSSYYYDWQTEGKGEMLPVSVLEGTAWFSAGMCYVSFAGLCGVGRVSSLLSQCRSFSNHFDLTI